MTPMVSASAKASSWSCVTSTVVMPSSRCTARMVRRSSSRILASSAPKGSSSSSTCGLCASARATATRCCWPPESCPGRRSSMPSSATSLSNSLRRARRSARLHAPDAQREFDVVGHGHVAEQRVVLEYEAHAAIARPHVGDVTAVQGDAPVIDAGQAGDGPQQRALAAAARDPAARRTRPRRLRWKRR